MMAALTALQIVPAILLALFGAPMLPILSGSHYELMLLGSLIGVALAFVAFTRMGEGQYRIGSFAQAAWLFALAWCAVHALGGVSFRLNLVVLLASAALIGTQAHPVHSVYVILMTIAGAVALVTNRLYGYLPGTPASDVQNIPEYVFSVFFPVVTVVLFQVVLLGFRRGSPASARPTGCG